MYLPFALTYRKVNVSFFVKIYCFSSFRLLVGAPLGKNLQPGTNHSGALYRCPVTTNFYDCEQVVTDGKRSKLVVAGLSLCTEIFTSFLSRCNTRNAN